MQVKYDRKLLIAIGRSRKASQWQNKEMLWSEFLDKLATTTRTCGIQFPHKKTAP